MQSHQGIWSLLGLPIGDPELAQAQLAAFSRQVPLLYFVLVVNTLAVAYTHHGLAPAFLTVVLPAIWCVICTIRVAFWYSLRHRAVDHATAVRNLQTAIVLVLVFSSACALWSAALFAYGTTATRSHIVLGVALTVIGCCVCLVHLKSASILMTGLVFSPFLLMLALSGDAVFPAMAANIALVSIGTSLVMVTHQNDFRDLIASRKAIVEKSLETLRLSDENARLASVDPLTELPNRRRFFAELSHAIDETPRPSGGLAVGLLDLDGFRSINSALGHAAGDVVLKDVARRLSAVCEGRAFPARLGGDEFAFLVRRPGDDETLRAFGREVAEALRGSARTTVTASGLSASIGLARVPEAGATPHELFERADYAMSFAKRQSRGSIVVFSEEHEEEIRTTSMTEQALRDADLDTELRLMFQPIVSPRGSIVAFEALARWSSPSLGEVLPSVFIPVAERSTLINRLTLAVLRKGLAAAATWPEDIGLSINLSARDIVLADAVDQICGIIARSGVAPARIGIEITETAAMQEFAIALEHLWRFRELGLSISLDDFGTGHSSLGYVHRLPLDRIKVDRSFVSSIETDNSGLSIVRTVIELSRNLGLDCVIEGIETQAQRDIVTGLGDVLMQGYLFGRPMSEEEVAALLSRHASRRRAACPSTSS
ncbi:putative bifunctional diguanylate cyclase/phosphodiesterase [Lutibaculum baratangense]|uniref:Diguanylate cyclase/phosphodiesterase (GGDEF & EAL domains) with PAS/PAC sensor(S) n=1 Tax=Lutibaculum baratangense AMV1 TaxID=631454 RepID=V4RF30_9HYPH|nr:EAL domain-containing protein [Lutibaculum baratangense]ESR24756.1 diguanylate cyclase/phosphodiesterase (GGDEF & EAL domains) with PAS/PAC sensor(s) [Lutibaculum baratangense AMV1]